MHKTFIIAEAGVNHNGDISLAKKLIDAALYSGVDAVKFQTWKTELLVTLSAGQADYQEENTGVSESQFSMIKKLELTYNDFRELKTYCDDKGILFLSTPDEFESATFLNELQSIFKIGSGELNNIPFLRHIATLADKVILSTGMGELGEIEMALDALIGAGMPREKITVLHATTEYPTPMKDVNLRAMQTIAEAFKVQVGYSDHTLGIEVPVAAVALGASVIEKHFTLDRTMTGPDHRASLEPDELKGMVDAIRNIETALGSGIKKPCASELKNKQVVRKSIVAQEEIKKGELLSMKNMALKRAGSGIAADRWDEMIGRHALRDYRKDDLI